LMRLMSYVHVEAPETPEQADRMQFRKV